MPSHWVLRGNGRLGPPRLHERRLPLPGGPALPARRRTRSATTAAPSSCPPTGRVDHLVACASTASKARRACGSNGAWVGMARGSRLAHEFDVTERRAPRRECDHRARAPVQPRVLPGGSGPVVAARHLPLRRACAASPPAAIEDLWIDTDYEAGVGYATVEARVLGAHEASLVGRLSNRRPLVYLPARPRDEATTGATARDRLQVGRRAPVERGGPRPLRGARQHQWARDGLVEWGADACASDSGACSIEGGVLTANGEPLTPQRR